MHAWSHYTVFSLNLFEKKRNKLLQCSRSSTAYCGCLDLLELVTDFQQLGLKVILQRGCIILQKRWKRLEYLELNIEA